MKLPKLPKGTKRTIGAVLALSTTFAVSKGFIDAETATYIGGLSVLIFGYGVRDAVKKRKNQ
ncbi:MAG: hypothetical protein QNK20_16775 [Aureibaculum sp.]|nr:hypothetical protein [Aureibaculum sp.]